MSHRYVVVDAFAEQPLTGNPAAIFFDSDDLDGHRMQRIAREMNLSEVVFVLRAREGGDHRLRIFTPVNELPFAGHPFLAAGLALAQESGADHLDLETGMGTFPLDVERNGTGRYAWMRQPIPTWEAYAGTDHLLELLGLNGSTMPVEAYRNGPRHVLVGVASINELSAVSPDHRALAEHPDMSAICFAPAARGWRCRMFSPAYGVVEDAATGSAAGPLAIHLARHGMERLGSEVQIVQGVEIDRRSVMTALVRARHHLIVDVMVGGSGVVAARGELLI